ncbi:MAG: GGDEF domain-containing protein [Cetobacterium sp.]|uniref:GGDEF domain-containing protein n=1 Tax=Cetobacterium sp. TaxID=2071632 RepID=UPI003F3904A6
MKRYARALNFLFVFLLVFSFINKKEALYSNILVAVEQFNNSFDEKIYVLRNEINYLYKTRKRVKVKDYEAKGLINYFDDDGQGVFFDSVVPMPKTYYHYNFKGAKDILNKKLNNSLQTLIYNKINPFSTNGDIIVIDTFDKRWVDSFQENVLLKSFFKLTKSVSRDNIEFMLYDRYKDFIYNKNVFSIIIPEYNISGDSGESEILRGIWYFDLDGRFFLDDLKNIKARTGLNAIVLDSKGEIIASLDQDIDKKSIDVEKYYQFSLERTNYKVLIQKFNIKNFLDLQEVLYIIILIALRLYFYKKERLESELDKMKLEEKIRRNLLLRDSLTRLYNRHFVEHNLSYPMKSCGVVLLDIDYFKSINDSYGHDKGDHVLRAVSDILKLVGGKNSAIRWGGEEFLLLFKNTSESELLKKLELMSTLIRKLNILDARGITVSVGATIRELNNKQNLYSAISESDKKLYEAKNSGRDRIVF